MKNNFGNISFKLFLTFFIIPTIGFCQVIEKKLPESLKPFVLNGYEFLDFIEGDLNADKRPDAILVLKIPGEDTVYAEDLQRPFLLLIRQPDGKLKVEKRNDNLVMCRHCGGIYGDPYEGIEILKNGFSISFYGGSSWRWSYTYNFGYNFSRKNWFLIKEKNSSYHNTEPEINTKECSIDATELGIISIEQFTSQPVYTETEWLVKVPKAYFFNNPKLGSKPRKAYLLKGDHVTGTRILKNFIEVSFQSKNESFTSGFMLKSNLQKIK